MAEPRRSTPETTPPQGGRRWQNGDMSPQTRARIAVAALLGVALLGVLVVRGCLAPSRPTPIRATEVPASSWMTPTTSPTSKPSVAAAKPSAPATTGKPADTQAPTAPGGLALAGNDLDTFRVTWTASTDNTAVKQYLVAVNGVVVAIVTEPSAELVWPLEAGNVLVQVAAVDQAGNQSPWTAAWVVPPTGPNLPPAPPAGAAPANPRPTKAVPNQPNLPPANPPAGPATSAPPAPADSAPAVPPSAPPSTTSAPVTSAPPSVPPTPTAPPTPTLTPTLTPTPVPTTPAVAPGLSAPSPGATPTP